MNKLPLKLFSQLFMDIFEGIEIDITGNPDMPWFLASDISKILKIDYKSIVPIKHISTFDDKVYVSSTGLYHMLMKSNDPQCVYFQEAVFEGCFPHISDLVLNSKPEFNVRPLPKEKNLKLIKITKRTNIRKKKNKPVVNLSSLLEKLSL